MRSLLIAFSFALITATATFAQNIGPTTQYVSKDGEVEVMFAFDATGEHIIFTIRAQTTGWAAIGFEPTTLMHKAEIIFVGVNADGESYIEHHYANTWTGHQRVDTMESEQGKDLLELIEITQDEEWLTATVRRKTEVSGRYYKQLTPEKELVFMWAIGRGDNTSRKHTERAKATITLPALPKASTTE